MGKLLSSVRLRAGRGNPKGCDSDRLSAKAITSSSVPPIFQLRQMLYFVYPTGKIFLYNYSEIDDNCLEQIAQLRYANEWDKQDLRPR